MAIYKLSEKIGYIRGNTTFQKKDLLSSGQYIALHYGKTYKLNSIEDTFEYYVGPEFFKPNQIVKKGDTIVITTSETIPELGKTVYYNADRSGLLGGEQIKIYPLDDSVNKKYLFYWFKANSTRFQKWATGIKVHRFKGQDFSKEWIDLPSQKQQQQIIDIIKLHEKLFFKYSAYVRINNIKNTLNDMRLLIDIIEPFESSLASLDVVDLQIEVALEHFINKQDNFILLSEISSIRKYSKLIKSTHLSDNGKYFYSTGKTLSNKKKTNEFNFKTGVSIPYEGAGMLFKDDTYFVRYHDENSYIARKFGIISDYPLTIYYSIHNKIDGTTSKNIGLKMPKLTLDMLNNFKIICPNQTLEDNFQTLHSLKRKVAKIRKTINCNLDRIISKLLI